MSRILGDVIGPGGALVCSVQQKADKIKITRDARKTEHCLLSSRPMYAKNPNYNSSPKPTLLLSPPISHSPCCHQGENRKYNSKANQLDTPILQEPFRLLPAQSSKQHKIAKPFLAFNGDQETVPQHGRSPTKRGEAKSDFEGDGEEDTTHHPRHYNTRQ